MSRPLSFDYYFILCLVFSGFCLISLCLPQGHEDILLCFLLGAYRFNFYNRFVIYSKSVSVYTLYICEVGVKINVFPMIYQTFPYYLLKRLSFPH